MGLSHELISQFAKIVNSDKKQPTESTIYGTVVDQHGNKPGDVDVNGNTIVIDEEGGKYIKPDGSDQLIPITENEDDPAKANTASNTEYGDRASVLIKNHTATVTGNITSPSASNKDIDNKINEYDIVIAKQIQADKAYLENLITDKASVGELKAAEAKITELEVNKASIEDLNAANAEITNLKATKIDAEVVESTYATIEKLDAAKADIGSLDAEIADINTLMFGSASGNVLQTTFANAVIALLGDAQIKSAMIESLNASKINAGSINTSNVKMESSDGNLVISDNTIQISDDNRVRVQIGKDASNDYSINIWDTDGNLMFSEGGITDKAIKEAIIRNDMVADDANINARKLDIASLFTEINDSTETIKSTKIYFDSQKQTLDVAFNEMNTTVTEQGETIESQGTDISVIQGQIKSKVWQQDIDTATDAISTKYSDLEQTLEGFKTTVSETYSTKEDLKDLVVGGRNLLRFTADLPITYDLETGISSFGTARPLTSTEEGIRFDVPTDGRGGINIPLITDGIIQNGETVTISFDYRGNFTDVGSFYFIQRESPNVSVNTFPDATVSEEEWLHYTYTFSSNYANDRTCYSVLLFYMTSSEAGKWIEIKKGSLKLERGSNASDWTPAVEDLITKDDLKITNNNISTLDQTADRIVTSVSSLETRAKASENRIEGLADNVETLSKEVKLAVTKDSVKIEIQKAIDDGVKKVDTGMGAEFDENGLRVSKLDKDGNVIGSTSTNINENGMIIYDNATNDKVLTANSNGVDAKNLNATTYLIIGGRSRFENYGSNRTGCFWIGGSE